MPLTTRPLSSSAPTAGGAHLVRYEVGDIVKQLQQLRRRLALIESSASQRAIESVIKACVELDDFLRDGTTDTRHENV